VSDETSSVVLDADRLDRLELVLGGWLPASALGVLPPGDGEVVLTDAENTPLARLRGDGDGPGVAPLAPLARGSGPQWDPAARLTADAARLRIGDRREDEVVAVAIDDLPTQADVARIAQLAGRPDVAVVVVVVPVRRRGRVDHEVGWAGLTRAAWAVADDLEGAGSARTVVRLVVPPRTEALRPTSGPPGSARLSAWRSCAAGPRPKTPTTRRR